MAMQIRAMVFLAAKRQAKSIRYRIGRPDAGVLGFLVVMPLNLPHARLGRRRPVVPALA